MSNKFYNFCNFNLKTQKPNLSKDSLSILDYFNVDTGSKSIKCLGGYSDYLYKLFGKTAVDEFNENNNNFLKNITMIVPFDYYDDASSDFVTFYFILDNGYNLYKLYFSNNTITIVSQNISFEVLPKIFTEGEKIYFYEKASKLVYFEGNLEPVMVLSFLDVAAHCSYLGTMFFVPEFEPHKVYYASECDYDSLGDDLSIYECFESDISNGKILKLAVLRNNLYAVTQYGIFKISSRDDKYYFSMGCYIKSKINASTICEINDYIIFFAGKSLYVFDGNQFKQIFTDETRLIKDCRAVCAEVFDNKYYLLADYEVTSGGVTSFESYAVEFDISGDKVNIFKIGKLDKMYLVKSMEHYELVFLKMSASGNSFLTFDESKTLTEKRYLKFNSICFNDDILKCISAIKIISSGNYTLKITSDISSKIFEVNGNLDISSLGILGFCFDIEIYSESDFAIKSMVFGVKSMAEKL